MAWNELMFILFEIWFLYQACFICLTFASQILIYECHSSLQILYRVIKHMMLWKCLALYFHHDSTWSKARMIAIDCWVENVLEKKRDCPIVKQSQKLLIAGRFASFFLLVVRRFRSLFMFAVARFRSFHVVSYSL